MNQYYSVKLDFITETSIEEAIIDALNVFKKTQPTKYVDFNFNGVWMCVKEDDTFTSIMRQYSRRLEEQIEHERWELNHIEHNGESDE